MYRIAVFLMLLMPLLILSGCDDDDIVNCGAIPAIPAGVYSVTHSGYVEIRWQENRDNGLTDGYGVYYYTGDVGNLKEFELMTTVDANPNNIEAVYFDYDVSNGSTYEYAVNAYNGYGESELSYEDVFDTPRPQGDAEVFDYLTAPNLAGFDFSRFRSVNWEDAQADVFFEYDPSWELFYVNVAGINYLNVKIQDYGYTDDITDVNWGEPGGGWSDAGWLPLTIGHAYVVRTADNHYAAFRVRNQSLSARRVEITWSYQLQADNPELKPAVWPPEHAENYGRRER